MCSQQSWKRERGATPFQASLQCCPVKDLRLVSRKMYCILSDQQTHQGRSAQGLAKHATSNRVDATRSGTLL